jgi:hypothetical protein
MSFATDICCTYRDCGCGPSIVAEGPRLSRPARRGGRLRKRHPRLGGQVVRRLRPQLAVIFMLPVCIQILPPYRLEGVENDVTARGWRGACFDWKR